MGLNLLGRVAVATGAAVMVGLVTGRPRSPTRRSR